MKKYILLAFFACFMLIDAVSGQRLAIKPSEMVAGEIVRLEYNPAEGPLENSAEVVGIAYLYNFYQWQVVDVELKKKGDVWHGEFAVPEDCGFVAFKFLNTYDHRISAVVDNNGDEGFMFIVKGKDGNVMPGGYLAWGLSRMLSLRMGIPNYFSADYKEISLEAMRTWLDKELNVYNQNGRYYFDVMKALLKKEYGKNSRDGIRSLLSTFERQSDLSEKDYMEIWSTYLELGEQEKADSIEQMILKSFPNGGLARLRASNRLNSLSGDEFEKATEEFRKNFPIEEWKKHPDSHGFVYRGFYQGLAMSFFQAGKYNKLKEILPEMTMSMLAYSYRKMVEFTICRTDTPAETYVDISKAILDEMLKKVTDGSFMGGITYSPKQAEDIARAYLDYDISVHAQVAKKCGRHEEAVATKELLPEDRRYEWYPAGNEAYVHSLEALNKKSKAIEAMKGAARASQMTPELFDELKRYYDNSKHKKDDLSFIAWLESLKDPQDVEREKADLKARIVDESFEPFKLETPDGKILESDMLKDGIVVIDFWALWCGPCIEALSGMQMAVNACLDDPDVRFYFVITQDEPRPDVVDKLWRENQYENMEVLYDVNREGRSKGRDAAFRALKSGPVGIPLKVILKDGKIRYRAEGYGGSPSGLMDEILYVIDILKNETR